MGRLILAAALCAGLVGCTGNLASDLQKDTAAVVRACATALPLASLAISLPTVGPFIAAGVQIGCATNAGIAKLAADPSSVEWLDKQIALLKKALGRA